MTRDPLAVLARLREAAVVEASRDLAQARAAEAREAARLAAFRTSLSDEQSGATADLVDVFAAWLPAARQESARLQAGLAGQAAVVRRLQQVLVARRTDAEAVAQARRRQRAEAAVALARKEQAIMDEAASRCGCGQ